MNHYAFSFLFSSVAIFFLACFVISRDLKDRVFRIFSIYSFTASLWSGLSFFYAFAEPEGTSLFFAHVLHIPVTFIPVLFNHFLNVFLNEETRFNKRWVQVSYAVAVLLTPLAMTEWMVESVEPKYGLRHVMVPGSFHPFYFLIFSVNVAYGLWRLFRAYRQAQGATRDQLRFLFFGTFIGYLGGIDNFLIIYGFKIFPLFPYGTYGVAFYSFVTAYAIIAHRFLNIEFVVRRTAVFAGFFIFVYGVFTFITILGNEFFRYSMRWGPWMAMVPMVLVITLTARPMENFLVVVTDRFLFQKKYSYQELLRTFASDILTVLDLQKLADQTVEALIKIMKLESASILLRNKTIKAYTVASAKGIPDNQAAFKEDDAFISFLKETHHPFLNERSTGNRHRGLEFKDAFKKLSARLYLPVELSGDLLGVLCLGEKKSGHHYTREEIDLLYTLARTEAIAISNAMLFDELARTQAEAAQKEKMAVIGTLAAGINHEINNPLSIARGLCEIFLLEEREGRFKGKSVEEMIRRFSQISEKVVFETDKAASITKRLANFARPSKNLELEKISVEEELGEVLVLIEHDLRKHQVDIQRDFPEDFPPIQGDKKQMQEIFFNLIRNAVQAIDKGPGTILLSGFSENGFAVIRITDSGAGIPLEKMERIFDPFYTTKEPGKGTGLGLFIVKRLVERHRGTILVESKEGIGTTFTLRFPAVDRARSFG